MSTKAIVIADVCVSSALASACGRASGVVGSTDVPAPSTNPTPIADSAWALAECNSTPAPSDGFHLRVAYESDAATLSVWLRQGPEPMSSTWFDSMPSTLRVAVCYFDGPWVGTPASEEVRKRTGVIFDRGIIYVPDGGNYIQGAIGPSSSLPLTRPHL